VLHLAPCSTSPKGDIKAHNNKALQDWNMYPSWEDVEARDTFLAEQYAEKNGEEATAEQVAEIATQRAEMAKKNLGFKARTLFGPEEIPVEVPRFDKEAKCFRDSSGAVFTKEQKDDLWNDYLAAGAQMMVDVALGDRDVMRYEVFGEVTQVTRGQYTNNEIKKMHSELPPGEKLIDDSAWID